MSTRSKHCSASLFQILTGRSNGENGLSLFRTPEDACRWGRVTARGPCLCLRGGPDLVLDPEGATG